jgi:2-methylcitrate dehydratase PrpD
MTSPDPSLSRIIADHVAGLTLAALPAPVLHATRRALLDALGVMLAASGQAAEAAPYHALARAQTGPARLLAGGQSTPALAALANGALAHALDYGDVFDAGPAHPHAALVPALLALADTQPEATLDDILMAMAAGSDLACRLSLSGQRSYEEGGWYPPPLVGLIGAAAASARLAGLDAEGIVQAMGLAMLSASFPAEIKYDPASPVRAVREGFAAQAAVTATTLAQEGARAFADPLGGKGGFLAVYAGGAKRAVLLDQLGQRFWGADVSFKPWPACRGTHAAIEAALLLRDRCPADSIASIEVETGLIQEMLISPPDAKARPDSAIAAKFSIPFCIGLALAEGAVGLDSFGADKRADPAILSIAALVSARRNPAWGHAEASSGSLTIHLKNGTRLHHDVPRARGHAGNPLSDADLIAKFTDCAARAATALDAARAQALAESILGADGRMRLADLLSALA